MEGGPSKLSIEVFNALAIATVQTKYSKRCKFLVFDFDVKYGPVVTTQWSNSFSILISLVCTASSPQKPIANIR